MIPYPRLVSSDFRYKAHAIFVDSFAASQADWVFSGTAGTKAEDFVNVISDDQPLPNASPAHVRPKSLKVTKANSGSSFSIERSFSPAQNWSEAGARLVLRTYIHKGTLGTDTSFVYLDGITVTIYNGSKSRAFVVSVAGSSAAPSGCMRWPGWHVNTLLLNKNVYVDSNGFGDADLANITKIRLTVYTMETAATPSITFDDLRLVQKPPFKIVSFGMDDVVAGQDVFGDAMRVRGYPNATFFVPTAHAGTDGYLSLARLHELQDDGHLIANHGTSPINVFGPTVPNSYAHEEAAYNGGDLADGPYDSFHRKWIYLEAKRWLIDNGFPEGADIYATSGGRYHPEDAKEACDAGQLRMYRSAGSYGHASYPAAGVDDTRAVGSLDCGLYWPYGMVHVSDSNTSFGNAGFVDRHLQALYDYGGISLVYDHAAGPYIVKLFHALLARIASGEKGWVIARHDEVSDILKLHSFAE